MAPVSARSSLRSSPGEEEMGVRLSTLSLENPLPFAVTQAIHSCQRGTPLTSDAIQQMIEYVKKSSLTPGQLPVIVNRTNSGLTRTVLITPTDSWALMTRATRERDAKFPPGGYKNVKYAVNLRTGEIRVVAASRRHDGGTGWLWHSLDSEVRYMQALQNQPGVVAMTTFAKGANGKAKGEKWYFLMPCYNGGDLQGAMSKMSRVSLSLGQICRIMRDCATGLNSIHAKEIIHGDMKPENILLDKNGGAVITDMGFACKVGEVERRAQLRGTPAWVAPEQAKLLNQRNRTDVAIVAANAQPADVWGLGLVFYEMLHPAHTGLACQRGAEARGTLRAIANLEQGALLHEIATSGIDQRFQALLQAMLQIDPKKRLTMPVVLQELETILAAISHDTYDRPPCGACDSL